jgi:hypothetical protein
MHFLNAFYVMNAPMNMYMEVEVYLHLFLTLAVGRVERSALHPVCFTPEERAHSACWIGGWVVLRASNRTPAV